MSWSPPQCPLCSSLLTQVECAIAYGPPDAFGVGWICEGCKVLSIEFYPLGPDIPEPGGCLNCGGKPDAQGHCSECDETRAAMVARVEQRCGIPPRLDAIEQLADQGLVRLALNAVDLRLQQAPNDPPTLIAKAKLMRAIDRPLRAVPLLRRAIELGTTEPAVAIDLGIALADGGQPQAALHVYEEHLAIETDPFRRAVTLTNMGGCFSALGQVETAEGYHRRAIEAKPDYLGSRWNLFANLLRQQRHNAALTLIDQTMVLPVLEQDERENLQAYRAEMLIALHRYKDALAAIDASLASDPKELARLGTRARILVLLGKHDAARACLAQVLLIDPDSELARRLLAKLDRTQKN